MNNEQIVNSIKTLCQEHNIAITKLEETLGMSQGLISRWNKSDPSLSKIIDIADYFKISLDEVVGYNQITNDEFLNQLILQTSNGTLKWNMYKSYETNPKQFTNKYAEDYYIKRTGHAYTEILCGQESSFFARIKDGYFSIYSYHEFQDSKKNAVIILFIQPDNNSELIEQNYSTKQLVPLWLKVLYSLNDEAPDDIKAEELKYSFLQNNSNKKTDSTPNNNTHSILKDSSLLKLLETFNTPEFQKLQQTFSSPEFQNAIQLANKIQQNLSMVQMPYDQKED